MKKTLQKFMILIIFCIFALLIYEIVNIYAVFHSEVDANIEVINGVWNITVNGSDITKGVDNDFVINQITTSENVHVKSGNLVPGLTGSFLIEINPLNTNVSVRYDVTLNQEKLGETNIKIKSINEIINNYKLIRTGENTYTGIMTLDEIRNGITHKLQVEIEWIDDGLNDENDSIIGKADSTLEIPVSFHAIQYLGEEIISITTENDNN